MIATSSKNHYLSKMIEINDHKRLNNDSGGLFHKPRLEYKPGLFRLVRLIFGRFGFIKQT